MEIGLFYKTLAKTTTKYFTQSAYLYNRTRSTQLQRRYLSSSNLINSFFPNISFNNNYQYSNPSIMSPSVHDNLPLTQPPCSHSHDHDHDHHVHISKEQISPFALTKDSTLEDYLYNNELWIEKTNQAHPHLFELNGKGQAPHTLWIGCSDSRYNENCLNVSPGEIFSFKSIANLVSIDDLTTESTLEFSINVLKVKKVIVCGHTDCGGILNSLAFRDLGPSNSHLMKYLTKLDELRDEHLEELVKIEDINLRAKKLAEYNVLKQLEILKKHKVIIEGLKMHKIELWGLIYNVGSGKLEVLERDD